MIFEYIHQDNSREMVTLSDTKVLHNSFMQIDSSSKLEFIKEFVPAYKSGQKMVLFDTKHKQLVEFYKNNPIDTLQNIELLKEDTQILFFTSGSSGFPVGAFKTKQNLQEEVKVLKELVSKKSIKRVVVSVPFVHIYGVLAGLLLPMELENICLVVKEDFLPYELVEEVKKGECLVITTPVFIKALAKLTEEVDLSSSTFVSSTGPLHQDDVALLQSKYNTSVIQLFGSTETGGIAYKLGTAKEWVALKNVTIATQNERLSVCSPYISEYILSDGIKALKQPFSTEDIIEGDAKGFTLLGRSNKIIKIAGKRISALAIEAQLEKIQGVNAALVELVYKKELLRSEQILITLEAKQAIEKSKIKEKINECYGVLTIPFKVVYVEQIKLSAMGKKVLF
jgi:acyl-coenzyme A synthetase/AMP-(fatty) acid ligase